MLSAEADAGWLAQLFGLAAPVRLIGPVDRGEQGQVWRLETGGGVVAVKETFGGLDDRQAALAHRLQQRAEGVGVRSPATVAARDGRLLVRDRGEAIRLYTWVDLAPPDRRTDPAAVGRVVARLHRAGGPAEADDEPWFFEPVGRAGWEALTDQLKAAGAPFADRLAVLVDELVAAETIMEPAIGPLTLCHRDLWADNVRKRGTGTEPMIIDWDNCGPASADRELAMVLVEFGVSAERAGVLYEAYRAAGGPGRVTRAADFTMPLAILGHLGELSCRQWLDARSDAERERATGRVEEFVGEPLTLHVINNLLSWLR